jgi:hypothetical protein
MVFRRRCNRFEGVDIGAVRGLHDDGDRRMHRWRPDRLNMDGDSMSDEINCQKERNALRTDVVIKENGSAAGVEVLEPSKVVNLTINDDPLKGE